MSEPTPGALAYDGLDASELEALARLRACVEREIIPAARALDDADEYPARGLARRWKDERDGT